MRVNVAQLATWIERDGWHCVRYLPNGGRVYAGPESWQGGGTIEVRPELINELDERRDRVAAQLHERSKRS